MPEPFDRDVATKALEWFDQERKGPLPVAEWILGNIVKAAA